MEERIRAAEEETRRRALNDFLQEFRVEERHYMRENKSASLRRKTMVLQERLFFRNIPLSNWVEHEITMEENTTDVAPEALEQVSIFAPKAIPPAVEESTANLAARLLR